MPASGRSYCVDGFIIRQQNLAGVVTRDHVDVVSSYTFEWNQELVTVTVEAYNSLGSSANNINMTLDSQPRREWSGRTVNVFIVSPHITTYHLYTTTASLNIQFKSNAWF